MIAGKNKLMAADLTIVFIALQEVETIADCFFSQMQCKQPLSKLPSRSTEKL
jgi:hypothetical protein